jgi:hypothetical protein
LPAANEELDVNDNQRTLTYVAVAALAVVIAWEPWNRRGAATSEETPTGKLFPKFDDPLAATSMRIVKYDEDTGAVRAFQVAQVKDLWSIPSHQNYPADAREHLAEAATAIIDLDILGLAGDRPGDHEMYGVLDPDAKDLSSGAVGVGTRVTMKGNKDDVLADLIIGKEVKDSPALRYVREPSRDQVYKVAVKTDKLSTKFGDWIEKDLLKLNAFDVRSVQLNDYSLKASGNGFTQVKRDEMTFDYDEAKSAWKLANMVEYDEGQPVRGELKEDEEINSEKLNALKTALDDLQIVDVERKPKELKGLQFIEQVANDRESIISLITRGFFPIADRNENITLYSKEGEAICSMKDGVEYVLRFGSIAGGENETADGDKKGKPAAAKLNRFLFVIAQFNPDLIPKPNLEPLPSDEKAEAEKPADKADAGDKSTDPKDKDGDKSAEKKPPAEKTADEQAAEEDAAERKKALAEKTAAVEKENKRKQDEYEEKIKKGQEHVKELNNRFADWYYIISDDTYHKIHLNRADVVKDKEKKEAAADSPDGLKELEKAGFRK